MSNRLILQNAATHIRLKNKATSDLPPPDKVPILIPPKSLEAIQAEGSYEFVESIAVPTEGTGGTYTAGYFKSLLDYLKQYPIPGSKDGHEARGNDFYTIGGDLQMKSENEGVCYLRLLVPPEGWNSSNSALISSLKAGIPELSIIADVEPARGNDGKVYFTKELGRPRNDIVPEGAMDVAIGNSADEKAIMALIEDGAIDMDSESGELVKNGVVYRRAAVKLQSTADKALAGRVLNAIAKKKGTRSPNTREKNGMNKEELIAALKAAVANNQITLEEIAGAVGLENKLRNAGDEQRTKLLAAITEALELPADTPAPDLLKAVEDALKEAEEAAETTVDAAANELANGKKLKNADGTETDNPVYLYAKEKLSGKRGKLLNQAAEALKTDTVMLSLRSKQADTRVNTSGGSGSIIKPSGVIREV